MENNKCPKCNEKLYKAIHEDSKTVHELNKTIDIYKYVCVKCGYVEERVDLDSLEDDENDPLVYYR